MDSLTQYYEIMKNRENMYRFLGRLYIAEVDESLLQQLEKLIFPTETGEKDMDEGYRLLQAYLLNYGYDPITDLAADYARVFLGAGIYEGTVANPYESVYTSPEQLIMQEARDEVLAAYLSKGLVMQEELNIPEDHIAIEFEFMAYMCSEAQVALDVRDRRGVSESILEQKEFLENHLLNWVPQFCEDIEKCSSTDFYQGLAKLTRGYLQLEKKLLEDLMSLELAGTTDY